MVANVCRFCLFIDWNVERAEWKARALRQLCIIAYWCIHKTWERRRQRVDRTINAFTSFSLQRPYSSHVHLFFYRSFCFFFIFFAVCRIELARIAQRIVQNNDDGWIHDANYQIDYYFHSWQLQQKHRQLLQWEWKWVKNEEKFSQEKGERLLFWFRVVFHLIIVHLHWWMNKYIFLFLMLRLSYLIHEKTIVSSSSLFVCLKMS